MSARNRLPFTAAQWQELEHQALIFKYMVSGIPVPPDLLYAMKRSSLDTPFISRLFPHQYPDGNTSYFSVLTRIIHYDAQVLGLYCVCAVGWNFVQMGSGRKIDPEPGRCRRTDGKKWRCSKEAYPDSKYCERHMHRGKNRSRKPVEVLKPTTTITALTSNPSTPPISSITHNSTASLSTNSFPSEIHTHSCFNTPPPHPFLYQHGSFSRPPGSAHLQHNSNPSLLLDPPADYRRNRYVYAGKEDVDKHPFLSEEHSGNMRGFSASSMEDPWQLTPLTMSCSSSSPRHKNCSALQGDYSSYLQLQSFGGSPKQVKQDEHYYAVGKYNEMQSKMDREKPEKTMHHFFGEWSPKDRESWVDLDDKSSNTGAVSETRLSMSILNSSQHDFSSIFSSNKHNEN
ncbi:growth-regulating factor 5-like isoform X3 [Cucurbita pepo subsp. pepo]|uniref:growth-regulating factor 5-like isoform X2 n=1 Tax=Cucurbita pepo subsp. pepo TaxID=3664 RepID=UPI000C9DA1A4|nr:growth-regulating factor 5-like isoform X2 [Cucurbita pepo subsp. pepo]XP_023546922.1 growth-regulating factor 5-like isoform X3 [Cucurbita pepo subsp. pepo]